MRKKRDKDISSGIPYIYWAVGPLKRLYASRYARKTAKLIKKGLKGVGEEAVETGEMADSFFRMLTYKLNLSNRKEPPTVEEVKAAIEQLKDVGRFSLFASISILPGGGFSLIGLELLARKLGVRSFTLIPSAFRKKNVDEMNKGISVP